MLDNQGDCQLFKLIIQLKMCKVVYALSSISSGWRSVELGSFLQAQVVSDDITFQHKVSITINNITKANIPITSIVFILSKLIQNCSCSINFVSHKVRRSQVFLFKITLVKIATFPNSQCTFNQTHLAQNLNVHHLCTCSLIDGCRRSLMTTIINDPVHYIQHKYYKYNYQEDPHKCQKHFEYLFGKLASLKFE